MKHTIHAIFCASLLLSMHTAHAGWPFSCCFGKSSSVSSQPYMPLPAKPSTSTYPAPTKPMPPSIPKFVVSRDVPLPVELTY